MIERGGSFNPANGFHLFESVKAMSGKSSLALVSIPRTGFIYLKEIMRY